MNEHEHELSIEHEHWFKAHWRPAAAWVYLGICLFDFVAAPVFFGWFEWFTKVDMPVWTPLTLQGGGLFHLSFGAIIGIYTWNRTKEKLQEYDYDSNMITYGTPKPPIAPTMEEKDKEKPPA